MFIRKTFSPGEKHGVAYINAVKVMGPVRLNVFAFYTDGIVIDTGAPALFSYFKSFFDRLDMEAVLLTHHHEDHSGGAAYLQERYGLPIYMHPVLIDSCREAARYPLYRKAFWGVRPPFQARPLTSSFESSSSRWKVIETPGHAVDHLSFINESTGQLFSGDLFVHPETKLILREESIPDTIASLEKLLTYDFDEMFCSHAGYIEDGRKALERKLTYLTELRDRVLFLAEKGLTSKEIQGEIFPKRYPITFFSFGEWDSKHIIRSILQA